MSDDSGVVTRPSAGVPVPAHPPAPWQHPEHRTDRVRHRHRHQHRLHAGAGRGADVHPAGRTGHHLRLNATYSPTSGTVTARNAAYNATLARGASTTLGFRATHDGNTGAPASFTLNGAACRSG